MGLLDGKVAIVTGGASGIGRATAMRFAAEGARVTVADLNEADAQETLSQIETAGGEAIFIRTDVAVASEVEAMVARTVSTFGRLDIAFNNAGIPGRFTNVVDCTPEEWNQALAINLTGVWLCMKYEIPAMIASGGGSIINTASQAADAPPPHMASYTATKAGVVGLTRSAALDFGPQNIRVNALLPGATVTPMMMGGTVGLDISLDEISGFLPLRHVAEPREQADVVLFLASHMASYMTGIPVIVDGGKNLF